MRETQVVLPTPKLKEVPVEQAAEMPPNPNFLFSDEEFNPHKMKNEVKKEVQ